MKDPMKETDFKMYGEYAEIVDFVGGSGGRHLHCSPHDQDGVQQADFDFGLAHAEEGYQAESQHHQIPVCDTVSGVLQYSGDASIMMVLGQPPFHVEYVSSAWTKEFGWSPEDIMGLDLRFLDGDGAIGINIRSLYDVAYTEQKTTTKISGYTKDGVIFSSAIITRPIYDIDESVQSKMLSNIAIEFTNLELHSDFPSFLLDFGTLNEIGLPLNRREYSRSYRLRKKAMSRTKPVASEEFSHASLVVEQKSLSDIIRFMSTTETSTAMALTDR